MEMKKAAATKAPKTRTGQQPKQNRGRSRVLDTHTSETQSMPRLPSEVLGRLNNAIDAGQWLIAVCHIENETLYLNRTAMNFPKADLDLLCRLFVENVTELKNQNSPG